ncbi:MAG: carbon-nitrogen hydrolase family protein [Candidatus Lokiarchaeota archaeon]|nr:carbon-nitrogen hydrolase family protein [Candidatus Lokiarchaeota archaeon]
MKVAAIQMKAELGNVEENLKSAERLAHSAFKQGAEMVILPEFFTSAVCFHPKMLDVVRPINGEPTQLLNKLAKEYNGIIGGSFIAQRGDESYNTFVLAFPDGSNFFHDKDQPTMWENCYYIGGTDEGILETDIGYIGSVLCWEFVRSRTALRLLNNVDLVVGGSCWWSLPEQPLIGTPSELRDKTLEMMVETPAKFARMLGVHVIHAAHAGEFKGEMPLMPDFQYKSYYVGETQIVDGTGKILARLIREDGEGFITADIDIKKKWTSTETITDRFWIPDMPAELNQAWELLNNHGESYYREITKPFRNNHLL